jgi:hypothetical protein
MSRRVRALAPGTYGVARAAQRHSICAWRKRWPERWQRRGVEVLAAAA